MQKGIRMEMEKDHNPMLPGFEYWDSIAEKLKSRFVQNPYFKHKRNEVLRLVKRWGKHNQDGAILKTDLYEEALEPDALLLDLAKRNRKVWGVDVSSRLARMASLEDMAKGSPVQSLCI